ncbi:MAG: HAMP domain-containing histidine kinase [Bacteroidetes bacterium]|nr:HAMP domain-containing histidine kinase [Bacteroidota bacterium]
MSIKYKIALLFALLVTAVFAFSSFSIYFFSSIERQKLFNTRLKNRALSTAAVYTTIKDSDFSILKKMDQAAVASLYNKSISIIGNNYTDIYSFSDKAGDSLSLPANIIDKTKDNDEYYFTYNHKSAFAAYHADDNNRFIIAVAATDVDGSEYLQQLKEILLIVLVMAVVLSFFGGIIFAKSLVRPIKKIMGEVNLITTNNFSQRIKIKKSKDELAQLAVTFNSFIDRLQESFDTQRRFISNASHELSTPLTSISSQLEVARQNTRSAEEYREVLDSVYEDIRELHLLTHSLLDIAKTGSHGSIDLNEVRLDEILYKVVTDVQKQNPGFKAILGLENFPDDEKLFTVFGNANLLYIALKNVIENGCKYSDNGESYITVVFDEKKIDVKVSNKGDVIAEADIQNIFQPFFRCDTVHSKRGFGLGLTLTKRILFLHKGAITVESAPDKNTVFIISLPNAFSKN